MMGLPLKLRGLTAGVVKILICTSLLTKLASGLASEKIYAYFAIICTC